MNWDKVWTTFVSVNLAVLCFITIMSTIGSYLYGIAAISDGKKKQGVWLLVLSSLLMFFSCFMLSIVINL